MQISDIKRELDKILLTCHELDVSDTVDYFEETFFDENLVIELKACQKNLNALRKELKSSLAKYWSKELHTALRQYNKIVTPQKAKPTKMHDDMIDFDCFFDDNIVEFELDDLPNAFFKYDLYPIRTYTVYENLLFLDEDLNRLHEIIELLSSVLKKEPIDYDDDDNAKSNYYIRRITTGSLELVLSTALPAASAIVGFIFLIIKECQLAKKRQLSTKLKEKELAQNEMKITSQIINDAAKILSVDPENEIYRKMIHQAGVLTLTYLQHNLHGSINGEEYRIPETPTLEIEKITLEIEEITNNGEE